MSHKLISFDLQNDDFWILIVSKTSYFLLFLHNHLTDLCSTKQRWIYVKPFPIWNCVRRSREARRLPVIPEIKEKQGTYHYREDGTDVPPEHQPGAAGSAALWGSPPEPTAVCSQARFCSLCLQEKLYLFFWGGGLLRRKSLFHIHLFYL